MRIAYVNSDEVNRHLAAQIASRFGASVCELVPRNPVPDGLYDAVLYNMDDVPLHQRSALVEGLRHSETGYPTAVHGYGITDEQVMTLRQHGVDTARQLHSGLLQVLINAARVSREAIQPDSKSTDLTWVNLAK